MVSALHPTEIYKKREILPLEAEVYLLPIPTCRRPPLGLFSSTNNFSTSTTHPLPFYTDPSRMDTDEDGVTDYIELQGWDVIVIYERRGEVMKDRCKNGVWSLPVRYDSEGDGASDEIEWKFHGDPGASDSDKDGIPDSEEPGPNLTMVEGTPPVILDKKGRDKSSEKYSGAYIKTKVKIKTKWSISGVKIKGKIIVIFRVIDNAGLDKAVIYVQTAGKRIICLGGDKRREIEEVFEIGDLLRLIHGGYDIRVNVTDINGNWATGKTHIDSALQTLKKGLSALLDMIVAALKVIAKVASMLIKIVEKIIKQMLKPVLSPIMKGIEKVTSSMAHVFNEYFKAMIGDVIDGRDNVTVNNAKEESENTMSKILDILTSGGFFYCVFALVLVIQILSTALSIYFMGSGALIGKAVSIVTVELAQALLRNMVFEVVAFAGLTAIMWGVKPKNDQFWNEGLGLSIYSFIEAISRLITTFFIEDATGVKMEVFGLSLAIAGLFLQTNPLPNIIRAEWALWGGLIIAAVGTAIVWANRDVFDLNPLSPLNKIEEILSSVTLGYCLVGVIDYYLG